MENYENTLENIKYPEIASEIERMAKLDQNMREKALKEDNFWDEGIDLKNTARMKEIIVEIGWPTITKVGKDGSENAWLLVQHSDHDPVFQRMCLELMKQESQDEVLRKNIAYLEDRVLLKERGLQKYGTQFREINGKFIPLPLEDEKNVEERRKEMGLDTLEENIQRMYEKYKKTD